MKYAGMRTALDTKALERLAPRVSHFANLLLWAVAIALALGGALASAAGVALAVAGEDAWTAALTAGPCLICGGAGVWRLLGNELRDLERLIGALLFAKAAGVAGLMLLMGIPGLFVHGAPHLTWLAIDVAAIAVLLAYRAYWSRSRRPTARG